MTLLQILQTIDEINGTPKKRINIPIGLMPSNGMAYGKDFNFHTH